MEISFNIQKNTQIAVAVSGGSDSMALLHLLIDQGFSEQITVLHFDHNLRTESESEANRLRTYVESLSISFISAKWQSPVTEGNLQQAARLARYAFFKKMCLKHNLDYVMVAHSMDDVAETFLMRLARGSGLRGLSSMQVQSDALGVKVVRPLLHIGREVLQSYLVNKQIKYISDPSNDNPKFFRIRIRKLKKILHDSGLTYQNIRESALSLRRADDALEFYSEKSFKLNCETKGDKLLLNTCFLTEPSEICLRVLEKSILSVTGDGLAPRTSKRYRALQAMKNSEKRFTLGGVIFTLCEDSYLLEIE
ncbi:MAG: tRNA(Ile)-lysidine synthase [Alphaproteobacteria bacterium]|jgi:tRNA(Ile)-lysidine synthase